MLPVFRYWWSGPDGIDRLWLPVVVTAVIVVAARRTRWTLAVATVGGLWLTYVAGREFAARLAIVAAAGGAMWGLVTGGLPTPRWRSVVPPVADVVPAVVALAAGTIVLGVDPRQLRFANAAVIAAVALAAPVVAHRVAPSPLLGRVSNASVAVGATVIAWVDGPLTPARRLLHTVAGAAVTTRDRWWRGAIPSTALGGATVAAADVADDRSFRGRLRRYRTPILVWLGTFVPVNAIMNSAALPSDGSTGMNWSTVVGLLPNSQNIRGWIKWDANQYLDIAANGYHYRSGVYVLADGTQQPAAWFPGYGLLVRIVATPFRWMVGAEYAELMNLDAQVAVGITFAGGLAIALLFWKWTAQTGMSGRSRIGALLCLMWFPYSFMFYGAAYSDPTFTVLAIGAFVLWRSDRFLTAGIVGALAGVVRVNGVAIVVGLAVLAAIAWREGRPDARRRIRGAALSATGIVGFVAWCGIRYGEPLLYWNAHRAIFAKLDPLRAEELLKVDFVPSLVNRWSTHPGAMVNLAVEALITVFCLASLPAVRRRFDAGCAAFVGVQVAIIWMGSIDFIGAGRYLSCAFPVAALWGEWLAVRTLPRRVVGAGLAATGLAGTLALTYWFSRTVDLGW